MDNIPLQNIRNETYSRSNNPVDQECRAHVRRIFKRYDRNNDGSLNIREMQKFIQEGNCFDLPPSAARRIINFSDIDNDGRLDFEEFYQMYIHREWIVNEYILKYCKIVVPPRNKHHGVGSYEARITFCPPPLTMLIFSIIELIIFLFDVFYLKEYEDNMDLKITDGPAAKVFIYNSDRRYEAWRFITYMFVHVGIMHLMMNVVFQLLLGVALELVHHWWRVALIYLAGVAAGSMGTSIFMPSVFLAGASGGVYAIITAHLATIIINWREMKYAGIHLFIFIVICATDIINSVYQHLKYPNGTVSYISHICGAIAGLLVGIGILRNLTEQNWERRLWWCAIVLYFALMLTGMAIHILYPQHFRSINN